MKNRYFLIVFVGCFIILVVTLVSLSSNIDIEAYEESKGTVLPVTLPVMITNTAVPLIPHTPTSTPTPTVTNVPPTSTPQPPKVINSSYAKTTPQDRAEGRTWANPTAISTLPPTQTQRPTLTSTEMPTASLTPTSTKTPTATLTPTNALTAQAAHDQEMQRAKDRRISWVMDFATYKLLPVVCIGIVLVFIWFWFKDRDKALRENNPLPPQAPTTTRVIPINGVSPGEVVLYDTEPEPEFLPDPPETFSNVQRVEDTQVPAPTIEQTVRIANLLIQGGMTRSAIAVQVFGNSGSTYLPKVDMVGKMLLQYGLIPEYPPPPHSPVVKNGTEPL